MVCTFSVCQSARDLTYIHQSPKWQAIFAEHPPLAVLPLEYLPHLSGGAHAPRFFFGWAFDKSSFLGVARRRRLTFTVNSYYRRRFGGLETFNFGDLTEDQVNNPALTEYLHSAAAIYVHSYILQQTRAHFTVEHMLSQRWTMMYALWTNYDIKKKYSVFKAITDWEKVETFMDELLNECLPLDSERSEPLWWWSVDNRFVSFSRLLVLAELLTCACAQVRP